MHLQDSDKSWLVCAGLLGANLPYTEGFMVHDIKAINADADGSNKMDDQILCDRVQAFGRKHHMRTLLACGGLAVAVSLFLRRK